MKNVLKISLTLLTTSAGMFSHVALADGPLKTLSCSAKGVSYTVTMTSEFAPGSKISTNIALTRFSVNPDGTARIESDEEAVFQDQIFDNETKAMTFFKRNDVILQSEDGTFRVLSMAKKTLMVLNTKSGIAKTLSCKL